jgi:hypothetical protein
LPAASVREVAGVKRRPPWLVPAAQVPVQVPATPTVAVLADSVTVEEANDASLFIVDTDAAGLHPAADAAAAPSRGTHRSSLGRPQSASAAISTSRSWKLSYRHSLGGCCVEKRAVASDHDDVRIADSIGSREVDRVIPAQLTNFSQLASAASEGVINFHKVDFLEQGVEPTDSVAQLPSCEAAEALGLGESSARLRVDEPDAHDPISAVPQRRGTGGARLGNQQRDDR